MNKEEDFEKLDLGGKREDIMRELCNTRKWEGEGERSEVERENVTVNGDPSIETNGYSHQGHKGNLV